MAQFGLLSVMGLKELTPSFAALKNGFIILAFAPVNGESSYTGEAGFLSGLGLYSEMALNFCVDGALLLFPLSLGLIILLLSKMGKGAQL